MQFVLVTFLRPSGRAFKWKVIQLNFTFCLFCRTLDDQYGLEEMCSNLVRDMNEYGVCVLDNFIGEDKGLQVLDEVKSMYSAGYFKVSFIVEDWLKKKNLKN